MARSLNKVMLIGNLGADPEVRSTANGSRVANLRVATSRQWNNKAGERQEKTEWHNVVAWNTRFVQLADFVEKYLKKGDRVYIEGRIEYRTWEDREGNTRYATDINARELIPLSSRGVAAAEDAAQPARAAAQPVAAEAKPQSFEDFPEALDEEDDDLPF